METKEELKNVLKQNFGLSNDEVEKVPSNILRILDKFPELAKYEIETEVISAINCSAGIQQGEKFVFSAMPIVLKVEKSTAAPCMRALWLITPFLNSIADRIVEGIDPNGSIWQVAECLDPGLGNGGLGKVRFKFTAKQVSD
jgi:uncharacterized repeat protein (TIGR04076 family)